MTPPTEPEVRAAVKEWPETSRAAVEAMLASYGLPQEVTAARVVWHRNGPWKRTSVLREEADHFFPVPHKDVLEQVIDYRVPLELYDEIAGFNGSLLLARTRGEVVAACGSERANVLAVNLMDGIVTGRLTVAQARQEFTRTLTEIEPDAPVERAERFLFDAPSETCDPDAQVVSEKVVLDKTLEVARAEQAIQEGPAAERA